MIKLIPNSSTGTEGGISEFQWGALEQVWPFEKASDGSTLYCKQIDFGSLPNSGLKSVVHSISGLVDNKVFKIYGQGYASSGDSAVPLPYVDTNPTYNINLSCTATYINMACNGNFSTYAGLVRVIYSK